MSLTNDCLVTAKKLLFKDMAEPWLGINNAYIKSLAISYEKWLASDDTGINAPELTFLSFMLFKIDEQKNNIEQLKKSYSRFNRVFLKSIDNAERQEHILNFSAELGADKKTLIQDKKAFSRWFGRDAINERYQSILFEKQRCLTFYLDRLGSLFSNIIPKQDKLDLFWHRFRVEETLRPLLAFDGDERVRLAGFKCLSRAVSALPVELHNNLVSDATVQYIYRSALERRQDIWIQREALSLLSFLSTDSLEIVLQKRMTQVHDGDDFFVRRHAVSIIGELQHEIPSLKMLLFTLVDDPSPSVRQKIPQALLTSSADFAQSILSRLLKKDDTNSVRASAILIIPEMLKQYDCFDFMHALLSSCFDEEQDEFVLKTLLKTVLDALIFLKEPQRIEWIKIFKLHCQQLHSQSQYLSIRRMAAQNLEWLWLYENQDYKLIYDRLFSDLENCAEGKAIVLPKDIAAIEVISLGRIMSLLAQNGFSLTLEKSWRGLRLRKGERFGFRWWRFLHELRHSSTDKRQSHRHTIGRHYYGLLHSPSHIMAELAETRVPGEPLFISEENASRYYLPLVDHALSALDQSWPTQYFRIVSAEGVTELKPPENVFKRLKAHLYISSNFAEFSKLRNWQEGAGKPAAYIEALCDLGFEVKFTSHDQVKHDAPVTTDSSITRFFPAIIPFNIDGLLEKSEDYFFSVYENTLFHLAIFVTLVGTYFFSRHIYLNQMMRRARNKIPLVIGGWGTRGKSGTERLKAALFNAMGYSVVSKTTGCEAMFLHSPAFGSLREMFLFRPYDKATIWEQVDVVKISEKLGCDVFLWECMGLTPSYVHVLQRNWMRDDIATITNTYPDHEDLQGPAGYDIPRVMTNFIPQNSTLITSEEQMLPILKDSARKLHTEVRTVGWLQAGLICDDILQRFPYEEHPYNIALVMEMVNKLGIDEDFALKEMADKVVADLGVLKTYPPVEINGRRLEFINGMSANERFGALGNWSRMGMDKHDLSIDADVWVSTVINNRADRVPRSQVFASLLVQDISADRHILIGDNLQGLIGYIKDAWQEKNIADFLNESKNPQNHFKDLAIWLRVPISTEQVINRLDAMLKGIDVAIELDSLDVYLTETKNLEEKLTELDCQYTQSIMSQFEQDLASYQEYQTLSEKIAEGNDSLLEKNIKDQTWRWFEKKLIVIDDYYASGDTVVQHVVEQTPAGLKNRLMGMQNIKGTGLDFIYRWQAWDSCYHLCEQLFNKDVSKAEAAVKELAQFQEYGVLCEEKVQHCISDIKDSTWTQREEIQAELSLILSNSKTTTETSTEDHKESSAWMLKLAEYIEAFLDAGDAVKRRKLANQIYKDLVGQRISHQRAAVELQQLNKRQKGGWGSEYLKVVNSK